MTTTTASPITADQVGQRAQVTITGRITNVVAGQLIQFLPDGSDQPAWFPIAAPSGYRWTLEAPCPRVTVEPHDDGFVWRKHCGHSGRATTELSAWREAATHTCAPRRRGGAR